MNIVCRLMCRDEIEAAMRGEEILKGDKGEAIYKKLVGNSLSFSPIKYCDMVSLGDLTVILANMKNFFVTHSAKEARKRDSKVYMVVFEDDGETDFSPNIGQNYRTKYSEPSKELLTYSYSLKSLKPLRMYEIDMSPEMENDFREQLNFMIERAPIEGYNIKLGFPVMVDSYEEAVNDMLHTIFTEEEMRQIYEGFDKLEHIEWLNEEDFEDIEYGSGSGIDIETFEHFYEEFYGRPNPRDAWYDWDKFYDAIFEYETNKKIQAEQVMKATVAKDSVLTGENTRVRQELSSLARQTEQGKDNLAQIDDRQVK